METQDYIEGVIAQNRRIVAKTITLIESSLPSHQEKAKTIVDALLPHSGQAVRIGITGVPGVGKSTYIESFGLKLVEQGHRVAVLAVDPSSSKSGGSIMGDKTRMERLSLEPQAFIRPSPSGGTLGGVARRTRETIIVCEAAGFDVIIVETVGVGQSETTVASMVDFFLVLMLAGAGDELQGIKKGVLELADAIAINKADGDNIENARKARVEYKKALSLLTPSSKTWSPPVLTCSAVTMDGIDDIWQTILDHRKKTEASGELAAKRSQQALDWMWALVEEGLIDRFYKNPAIEKSLPAIIKAVEKGQTGPTIAAHELLFLNDQRGSKSD
jgi:LAO/AO transport system kinase